MLKRILPLIIMIVMLPAIAMGADFAPWVWLQESWKIIVGVVLVMLGAFWIPGLRTIMVLGLKTLVSEKVLKSIFIMLAERLVASTKTKIDDLWLRELKKKLL